MSELTLGGYMAKHERAAAFGGSDGQAYSVAIYVDEEPDVGGAGRGARRGGGGWDRGGPRRGAREAEPVGHVETETLAWGHTAAEAEERLKALSLYDVKAALDESIARAPAEW